MISQAVQFGIKVTIVTRSIVSSFIRRPSDVRYVPDWLASLRDLDSPLAAHVPWLPYSAIDFIQRSIGSQSHVFEYGGGGSTLWFAERVEHLTTVEHDPKWYGEINRELTRAGLTNCRLLLREPVLVSEAPTSSAQVVDEFQSDAQPGVFEAYVKAIDDLPDQSLDVVLVDGRSRSACLRVGMTKVKPAGILVLDDSDRERYQATIRTLASWRRHDFFGIRRFSRRPGFTTCWVRPRV